MCFVLQVKTKKKNQTKTNKKTRENKLFFPHNQGVSDAPFMQNNNIVTAKSILKMFRALILHP